jgi:hypothetical protein
MKMVEEYGKAPNREEMAEMREAVGQDFRFAVLQQAQMRADRMKTKIQDQFAQGGWELSFNDFITDLVTFPAAFVKGPVVRRQRALGWKTNAQGQTVVEPIERLGPEYERVDPFYIYPEPGISTINEGYLFEYHPLSRMQLSDLIGVPGYDEDAIRKVLEIGNGQSWINEDVELQKDEEERKYYSYMKPTTEFDALEFWGKVSGKMLREWGLTEEEVPDEAREYDANVWMVGNYVIKAVLNYDPLGEKPYAKTSFIKCPGAFWGKAIPRSSKTCRACATPLPVRWSTTWASPVAHRSKSTWSACRPTRTSPS